MRMNLLAALALFAIGVGGHNIPARAQAQNYSEISAVPVASGAYKPLTTWDSISIGASYYTNPQRAKATSVVYSFDGPEFSDKLKSAALWKLASEGKVSFGIKDKNENIISVVPISELQKLYPANNPEQLTRVLEKDDVTVVYVDKTLLGETSKAPVVKTEAKRAAPIK